jgi:hypothetical protein
MPELNQSDIMYLFLTDSMFLDMLEVFEPEQLKLFIKVFGGTTIEVPTMDDIKNCSRDFKIYDFIDTYIKTHNEVKQENVIIDAISNCAVKYQMSDLQVKNIYANLLNYEVRLRRQKDKIERINL